MPMLPISRAVWGLDIAASAIKGVRMRVDEDRIRILTADILPIEGEPVSSDASGRERRIWQALQQFEAKHRLSRERVVAGLPGPLFFTRPFSLFLVGNKTEAQLAQFELEQHIPFGLDAVVWDYETFAPEDLSVRERKGLLFAMKKEALNGYLLSLAAARIEPTQIQAAPLALWNFVKHELAPESPLIIVDIGARSTNLIAADGDRYWARMINKGGENLTSAMQFLFQSKNVSRDEAERIKTRISDVERRAELADRLMPAARAYVGEMKNAVEHLQGEHDVKFERMVLLGGGAAMYGLQRLLSQELGLSVSVPAGLGRIECAAEETTAFVNARLPELATAIGLGLQGLGRQATRVNMVSAALARRRKETAVRRASVAGLAAALVLLTAMTLFAAWRRSVYVAGTEALRGVVGPVTAQSRAAMELNNPTPAEEQLKMLAAMGSERAVWPLVLDKFARMLPENHRSTVPAQKKLWLIRLSLKAKPNTPGVYEGEVEAGALLQRDSKDNVPFATRILQVPLKEDPKGIFRNVSEEILAYQRSPTLSLAGGTGADRYFVFQMRFEVAPGAGGPR
jgi:type IV pilus assembly protein PilM